MNCRYCLKILLLLMFLSWTVQVKAQEPCSTEKVNSSCTITIDRAYPLVLPTVQMRPGEKVIVKIDHSLPYEILSLDLQSGQAVVGTDQAAAFAAAALPNLKGLLLESGTRVSGAPDPSLAPRNTDSTNMRLYKIAKLRFDSDFRALTSDTQRFATDATKVYAQLNEVLTPVPPVLFQPERPASVTNPATYGRLPNPIFSKEFPHPWVGDEYDQWRLSMICELVGNESECPAKADASIRPVLPAGMALTSLMSPCPTAPPPASQPRPISCQIAELQTDFGYLTDVEKTSVTNPLNELNVDTTILTANSAAITSILKDLNNYYFNIFVSRTVPDRGSLGEIDDPLNTKAAFPTNAHLHKWLGRQVTFTVNCVNEVSPPATSVTAAQKKSIVTVTVLYADPKFEVSAGGIISTLPNRSFANQTIVTQNPGSVPTQGNVVITQMISRPTAVIFAGANLRLGHDFAWRFDQRRGAFYLTGTVGLNANNSAAEFGFGPSVSWRALMFSLLYDWGHDVRLTQGESVGMIWCNQTAANGSIPKCSGSPPAPSTEKYWRGVIAFGISVRVPSVFGGGGGSSAASGGSGH